jgi:hypothetical protein
MNKILLVAAFCLLKLTTFGQTTATDFTAADCDGNTFHLFDELNSGKVIVLCWVMPCGACELPALTTLNVVNSYISTNPHTVYMYVADDYANTPCASLQNWANNVGVNGPNFFSDASIDMSDYGTFGMPKIVVMAGGSHTIFYNAIDVVNAGDLQAAINAALQVIGIDEKNPLASSLVAFPNPANDKSELNFSLAENTGIEILLFNLTGACVKEIFNGELAQGNHSIGFSTDGIAQGTYLLKVSDGSRSSYLNLVIAH